ncbi:hypothetical protein LT493_18055 [Streptomyces tricolor]|nr:hypothetical protein [Streptomyces tricolor]
MWAGAGALPGKDGWVSLYLADAAPLLLPAPHPLELTALHQSVLDTPVRRLRPVLPADRRPDPRHHAPRRHRPPTRRRAVGPGLVGPAHQ